MSETVAPGTAYTSRLALGAAQTGLVGTVRYRLLDNDATADDPVYGPSTAGIIEDPTGSGSYVFTGTAPSTAGTYARAWDTGVGTDLVYDEDLVVSATYSAVSGVYDVTTDRGKVRLLISDVGGQDGGSFLFRDTEIDAFLTLRGSDVLLAAALALRTIAGNEAQTAKVIKFLDLQTDGAKTAKALLDLADKYEAQADGDVDFDVAEMGVDVFSRRALLDKAELSL